MKQLKQHRGRLEQEVGLARYCTWRVGGAAQYVYYPVDREDLCEFVTDTDFGPFTWLGLGSNVLIRDGGIPGTVIFTQECLTDVHQIDEHTVYVEAGVPCAKVAKLCGKWGLTGAEFFAGIPGSMGGALFMNAGAYGGETWSCVTQVETMDQHGNIHIRKPTDFQISYRTVNRTVIGPPEWFVSATIKLPAGDPTAAQAQVKELLHKRNESQPIGLPSGGSVFRNPEGDYAARLIEQSGLKGYSLGGAQVSPKHANFIINLGEATANDIEQLIFYVRETVHQKTGIWLEPEIKIIGIKKFN